MCQVGWHAEALASQPDGGLEKLCPLQFPIATVNLLVATELTRNSYPLGA